MPQATRVFERLKIDYCCGGHLPLSEACAGAGVNFDAVTRMLEEVRQKDEPGKGAVNFQQASLADLIDHIVETHHVYTKEEMVRLEALLAKVISVHGQNHPELTELGGLFRHLCADLNPHMFKEEQMLFPYIIQMEKAASQKFPPPAAPFGTVNNPVRMMCMEHDAAGEILKLMRTVTRDYAAPADACISYQTLYKALEAFEQDLHQHIHLENNILFPRAIETEESACRF
jgi:regulator of cell morphogenesis and NO signaling